MKGISQGRYTKEFQQEAVKLVIDQKLSWSKAAPSSVIRLKQNTESVFQVEFDSKTIRDKDLLQILEV